MTSQLPAPKAPSKGPRLELSADQQIRIRAIELLAVFNKDNTVNGRPLTPKFLVGEAKVIEDYIKGED